MIQDGRGTDTAYPVVLPNVPCYLLYWYKSACFTGTKVLANLLAWYVATQAGSVYYLLKNGAHAAVCEHHHLIIHLEICRRANSKMRMLKVLVQHEI